MAWTTPRTWVHTEVTTDAMHNAHIRDNLNILKTPRDSDGRLIGLSSTTLADLSAANLTGLAVVTAGNSHTMGRQRLFGTARFVVPVGTDKWQSLGGALRRGVWVEGTGLHHIAADQTTEYNYVGVVVSTPGGGALPGSVWVEENVHYIDASGVERRVDSLLPVGTIHNDTSALPGSLWIETFVHIIRTSGGGQEIVGHADQPHGDGTPHSDTAHVDTHSDNHGDTGHADSHTDTHTDIAHIDAHADHSDVGHADSHNDVGHQDSHVDSHTDTAHGDSHGDGHTDTHTDHTDHADNVHTDQPTVVP